MTAAKPHFRYEYDRLEWRSVSYPNKRVCQCEICGGPAVKHGRDALCKICSDARTAEIKAQRRVFLNAKRRGQIGDVAGRQCVDCKLGGRAVTDWEHRDWREPLKVQPVCRMHNSHRGRAMTAYEASFRQTGAECAP